jgi:cobalt-zinc-cadmium efflux system outer membrane protein
MNKTLSYSVLLAWVAVASVSFGAGDVRQSETDSEHVEALPAMAFKKDAGLQDYLKHAAHHNSGLEAAFKRWKAALESIPQARTLPDPRFNYTYFIEEVETRVGPQRQKFGVMQVFPWFGTRKLRGDAASEAAAAAGEVYERSKLHLFYRVKAAYYDYWYLAQAVAVTRQHIKLVTNLEAVARIRFKAGVTPHSAVIQAQVELGKLTDRLQSLESLRRPIVARLNAALNRPVHLPLPWPRALPVFDTGFTDEQAVAWLAESNPDLRRLDHLVEKEEAGIKLAKRSYYPDIALGVDYVDTDDALNPGVTDSGKDPLMATVSVNLPLWFGKNRAAEREAHLRKAAAVNDRDDTSRRLESNLELALYHFRDAERKINLYGDTLVPKAEQSLAVAQQGFEGGGTSFIALIDAQRLLLEFQLAQRRAQADRGTRLAEVEMLVGRDR